MDNLEINKIHINKLTSEQFREFVARLCEAEMGVRDFSPKALSWGGNHTAKDGGVDVAIVDNNLGILEHLNYECKGFIPKPYTYIQEGTMRRLKLILNGSLKRQLIVSIVIGVFCPLLVVMAVLFILNRGEMKQQAVENTEQRLILTASNIEQMLYQIGSVSNHYAYNEQLGGIYRQGLQP